MTALTKMAMARRLRLPIAVLCTLALALVAFAHRPLEVASGPSPAELAAYAFPDGSLPVICHGSGESEEAPAQPPCPVCTLTKAFSVPALPAMPVYEVLRRDTAVVETPCQPLQHRAVQSHRTRAPPLAVFEAA